MTDRQIQWTACDDCKEVKVASMTRIGDSGRLKRANHDFVNCHDLGSIQTFYSSDWVEAAKEALMKGYNWSLGTPESMKNFRTGFEDAREKWRKRLPGGVGHLHKHKEGEIYRFSCANCKSNFARMMSIDKDGKVVGFYCSDKCKDGLNSGNEEE